MFNKAKAAATSKNGRRLVKGALFVGALFVGLDASDALSGDGGELADVASDEVGADVQTSVDAANAPSAENVPFNWTPIQDVASLDPTM